MMIGSDVAQIPLEILHNAYNVVIMLLFKLDDLFHCILKGYNSVDIIDAKI